MKLLYELDGHITALIAELKEKYGLHLNKSIQSRFDSVTVLLSDPEYPFGKDWMPHMSFTLYPYRKIAVLKSIRLPRELQNRGIGTLCFEWLKNLCRLYGIEAIEGKAVNNSECFWDKQGVKHGKKKSVFTVNES